MRVGMGCLPCQLFPVAEKARKGSLSIFSVRSLEDLGEKSIFAARLTNRTLQNPKGAPLSVNLFWEGSAVTNRNLIYCAPLLPASSAKSALLTTPVGSASFSRDGSPAVWRQPFCES